METVEEDPVIPFVRLAERRRVAQALRDLASEIVSVDVGDDELGAVATALESLRDRLSRQPRLVREEAGLHRADFAGKRSGREPVYDRDPLTGLSNPLAPPLRRLECAEGTRWQVIFGDTYEGHPGFVHGGYVAAVLDHVLGVTASTAGFAAMTGTLTTRFRRPTPTRTTLACAGEVKRVDGRKVFCSAVLEGGGVVVAEADGVYFRLAPDHY